MTNWQRKITLDDKERIHERLKRKSSFPDNGCWLFEGCIHPKLGYGGMNIGHYKYATHQLSAYIFLGFDLESDLQVNHKCSSKNCWNPEHLYIGTQSENMIDRWKQK